MHLDPGAFLGYLEVVAAIQRFILNKGKGPVAMSGGTPHWFPIEYLSLFIGTYRQIMDHLFDVQDALLGVADELESWESARWNEPAPDTFVFDAAWARGEMAKWAPVIHRLKDKAIEKGKGHPTLWDLSSAIVCDHGLPEEDRDRWAEIAHEIRESLSKDGLRDVPIEIRL